METLDFQCPHCDRISTVPRSFAGKQGKCPGCLEVLEVPDPDAPEDAETEVALSTPDESDDRLGAGDAVGTPVESSSSGRISDRRPCPSCGEAIKRVAKKCRFCGHFLDELLGQQRRHPGIGELPLASPGTRFAAFALDFVMLWLPSSVLFFSGSALSEHRSTQAAGTALILVAMAHVALLSLYTWYLISTRGQTIAKRWFGIKIVRDNGAPVGFVTGVIVRSWVMKTLCSVPYIGWCLLLPIECLMIFGNERRCLHDHIAATRVIQRGRRPGG